MKKILTLISTIMILGIGLLPVHAATDATFGITLTSQDSSNVNLDLYVNSGSQSINTVQYSLQYDPLALSVNSVTDTSAWAVADSTKNSSGTYTGNYVSFSLFANPSVTGKSTFAKISFKIINPSAGTTTLSWVSKNTSDGIFAADGNATNVLNVAGLTTFNISTGSQTTQNTTTTTSPVTGSTLPNTGIWDSLVLPIAIGFGLIGISYFMLKKSNRIN